MIKLVFSVEYMKLLTNKNWAISSKVYIGLCVQNIPARKRTNTNDQAFDFAYRLTRMNFCAILPLRYTYVLCPIPSQCNAHNSLPHSAAIEDKSTGCHIHFADANNELTACYLASGFACSKRRSKANARWVQKVKVPGERPVKRVKQNIAHMNEFQI